MQEAAAFQMPTELKQLFVDICCLCSPTNAFLLFENNLPFMIEDYTRSGHDAEIAKNLALKCIQDSLKMNGRLSEDFNLPLPDFQMINQLVANENCENSVITRQERRLMGERMVAQLNTSQREAFDQIMLSINAPSTNLIQPRTFFLDGPGGTGKTFLYITLINVLQGQGKKVISASTGIAATLLTNGATYHSKFQIYPPITETTTSRIEEHEYGAQLIRDASLIICDEATMMSRYALKAIERILRKVMRNNSPYGRKIFSTGRGFSSVSTRSSSMAIESKWLKLRSRLAKLGPVSTNLNFMKICRPWRGVKSTLTGSSN
jgi:ATP-dependent DNA helicase PIF1